MKWAVEIQKSSLSRRNLADLFDGLGYELVESSDMLALTSPEWEKLDDAKEVWEDAEKVRAVMKGPAQTDSDFTLGEVVDYSTHPPRRTVIFRTSLPKLNITPFATVVEFGPSDDLSDAELVEWTERREEEKYQLELEAQLATLEPAFKEPKAARVLELFNLPHQDGQSLWKIYELIEDNAPDRNVVLSQLGTCRPEFERFSDAVHNERANGSFARHAKDEKLKTSGPMMPQEAEQYIRRIAKTWLARVRNGS